MNDRFHYQWWNTWCIKEANMQLDENITTTFHPSFHAIDNGQCNRHGLGFLRHWSDMKCYIMHPCIHPFIHLIKTSTRITYARHTDTGHRYSNIKMMACILPLGIWAHRLVGDRGRPALYMNGYNTMNRIVSIWQNYRSSAVCLHLRKRSIIAGR